MADESTVPPAAAEKMRKERQDRLRQRKQQKHTIKLLFTQRL
jgi:hypothetical protein